MASLAASSSMALESTSAPTKLIADRWPTVSSSIPPSGTLRRHQHFVDDVGDAVGVHHVVDADVGEAAGRIPQQQVDGAVEPRAQLGAGERRQLGDAVAGGDLLAERLRTS